VKDVIIVGNITSTI